MLIDVRDDGHDGGGVNRHRALCQTGVDPDGLPLVRQTSARPGQLPAIGIAFANILSGAVGKMAIAGSVIVDPAGNSDLNLHGAAAEVGRKYYLSLEHGGGQEDGTITDVIPDPPDQEQFIGTLVNANGVTTPHFLITGFNDD